MILNDLFNEILELSIKIRPNYLQSLGGKTDKWEEHFKWLNQPIPELFISIYNKVSGTKRKIKEQQLMDFIPGYRLIHISDLMMEKKNLDSILANRDLFYNKITLPVLANYSSDFICYCMNMKGEEKIYSLMHDNSDFDLIYDSPTKFFETVCEFYKQGVYFVDTDGYLGYDFNKESIVGSTINPGITYWKG